RTKGPRNHRKQLRSDVLGGALVLLCRTGEQSLDLLLVGLAAIASSGDECLASSQRGIHARREYAHRLQRDRVDEIGFQYARTAMERELNLGASDKSLRVSKIAKKVLQPTVPRIAPACLIERGVLRHRGRNLLKFSKNDAADPCIFDHGDVEGRLYDLLEVFPALAGRLPVKSLLHYLTLIQQQVGETWKVGICFNMPNDGANLFRLEPIDVVDDDQDVSGQTSEAILKDSASDVQRSGILSVSPNKRNQLASDERKTG